MVTDATFPSGDIRSQDDRSEVADEATEATGETTPGKYQDVRWEVVAVANGVAQASIIQGRLDADGIPARVHQEPAGIALGLTVGTLGQAEVLVPEPMVDRALAILEQSFQEDDVDENA